MNRNGFKTLTVLICLPLLLALSAFQALGEQPDMTARKNLYECQQKAAEYSYNLDKAGDRDIFQKHVQDCLAGTSSATPLKTSGVFPAVAGDDSCSAPNHPITFVNNSDNDIYLGVWQDGGVKAPAGIPDWLLPKGTTKKWCAPKGFHGRFITRTGCIGNKCAVGDCCKDAKGSDCDNNKCTATNQPASLAEFTMDDVNSKTWYNVSYVDGYNFPIQITPTDRNGTRADKCTQVGCTALPRCPWDETMNGVCLGAYKYYELTNPQYISEQQYFVLAAKCAADGVCGCGDQCKKDNFASCPNTATRGANITIQSAGCSPFAAAKGVYDNDSLALAQIVCDPLRSKSDQPDSKCTLEWADKYKAYPVNISKVCSGSYTWQYHDESSLTSCPSSDTPGFQISFGQAAEGIGTGDGTFMTLFPNTDTSGSYSVEGGTAGTFKGQPVKISISDKKKLTLTTNCMGSNYQPDGKKMTCSMAYDMTKGILPPSDNSCSSQSVSNIAWGNSNKSEFHFGMPSTPNAENSDNPCK